MKTNTITKPITQLRCAHNRAMVLVLFAVLMLGGTAWGQVTNIIYQDTFSRSGLLNGSAPDTADATGAKYIAGPLVFTGNWTDQNGNTENACYFSNAVPAVEGPLYNIAFLPMNIETGHVYTVTASYLENTNYTTSWMCLAFDTVSTLQIVQNDWFAGMLTRSTNNPGSSGNAQTFAAAGTSAGVTYNWSPSGTPWTPQFMTYSIVLNLTNPAAITAYWYTNGVAIRTNNFGANLAGANNGMWPRWVQFGQSGSAGYVTNFSVTDVVPFPAGPTILEQPNNLTAAQGQTATFWVNAIGTPDPTYQWMTNNGSGWVAITGATNATYTTPALSSSENGLSFEVQVSNVSGSVTSSAATLTVTAGHPTVYSVMKTASLTTVVVNFSGAVDPTTSQNAGNYALNNGASVVSVSPGSVPSSVILTTSTLNPTSAYDLTVNNVQDIFGDAMAAASTKAVLPAGLVLDLEGNSGVQVDTNGNVVQWLDQTTNGNNASQFFGWRQNTSGLILPSTTTRPSTNTLINGIETLTFTAANDTVLQVPSTPSDSINTNITIYVVAKVSDTIVNRHFISKNVGNQPGSFEFDGANNGGTVEPDLLSGSGGNGAAAIAAGSGVDAIAHVFAATRTFITTYTNAWTAGVSYPSAQTNWFYTASNSVSLYLDGIETRTNAAVNEGAPGCIDAGEPIYIGTREDHYVNDIMNGQIAEILIFNTPLSGADMTNVDNYLGQKWFNGVTFATAVPTITTSNGFAVTISPDPTAGSTHLSGFQWQENGTNIPGATGISYTTGTLAPTDNGDTFSLIASVFNGQTYTNTTTVDVLNEPPYVTSAGIPIWSTTNIVVTFDEAVDPSTVGNTLNYSLNNGANVVSATMGSAPNKVELTTSALTWNGNPGYYTLTVANVKDIYGNTMASASPSVGLYPPNVALWVKASTGVTADGSGNVSSWNDLSGNNNTLITISALDPLLATNANGNPVVRFNSTNETEMDALTAPSLAITNDFSAIAAINFATLAGGTNGDIVSKTGQSAANIPAPYDYNVGGAASLLRGNGGTSGPGISYGSFGATIAPAVGVVQIVAVSETGNNVSHYVNGQPAGTGLLSNGYTETADRDLGQDLSIGTRGDLHNRLTGDISELIVFGSGISSSDVASLDTYLAGEYNVVLFNASPTNILFSSSATNLTLSWPRDHTGWQLQAQTNSVSVGLRANWVNVGGSTSTNQMVIPLNLTNGTVFYRLIYNP